MTMTIEGTFPISTLSFPRTSIKHNSLYYYFLFYFFLKFSGYGGLAKKGIGLGLGFQALIISGITEDKLIDLIFGTIT